MSGSKVKRAWPCILARSCTAVALIVLLALWPGTRNRCLMAAVSVGPQAHPSYNATRWLYRDELRVTVVRSVVCLDFHPGGTDEARFWAYRRDFKPSDPPFFNPSSRARRHFGSFSAGRINGAFYGCTAPLWSFGCMWGAWCLLLARRPLRVARRRRRGLCLACGYDLRAHHPGDRCPECGDVVPPRNETGTGRGKVTPDLHE